MRFTKLCILIAVCTFLVACSGGKSRKAVAPTTTVTTVAPTTTTTISAKERAATKLRKAAAQVASDKTAIRHVVEYLNTSFRSSWQTGYTARAAADYYVWSGKYSAAQCIAFWTKPVPFIEDLLLHPESIVATPDWVDTIAGTPKGRVYSMTIDYTLSDPAGRLTDYKTTSTVHATVLPDGNGKFFLGCVP